MKNVVIGGVYTSLSKLIGKGGEGEVYSIEGHNGGAAKIYKADLRKQREDKVRAMVVERLADTTSLIAYPKEVITDHRGNFLGFFMRFLPGYRPLHELYSPKSRQRLFPKADYRFVIRAALNVVRAVGSVHQTGCVIGDLNHSGVLVAPDSIVALIDADSFQFHSRGKSYPCLVGVPEFTPPELHNRSLSSVERTIQHDSFGLAVAVFQLLFMGKHPYAGRYNGPETSMSDAIAQNRFAYSLARQFETQTIPPPHSPTLDLFPGATAAAFERAFGLNPAARPTASEWLGALNELERSLGHCNRVKSHYYPRNSNGCTWCKLARDSGFEMFPDLSVPKSNIPTDTRGTQQAIREIEAFRFPKVSDILNCVQLASKASSSVSKARAAKAWGTTGGVCIIAAALAAFIYFPGGWIIWILAGLFGYGIASNQEISIGPFQKAYEDADKRTQNELESFVQRNGAMEVVKVRNDLVNTIAAYKSHDSLLAQELRALTTSRKSRQLQAHLDRFPIRRSHISGIGPDRTATLMAYGIETAADVIYARVIDVPGFGPSLTGELVAWRKRMESRFTYNSTKNAQDAADDAKLRSRFATEKAKLESTIRNGLGSLRNAKARLDNLPTKARSDQALRQAVFYRSQAEKDLRSLGFSVPASNVSLDFSPVTKTHTAPPPKTRVATTSPPPRSTTPRTGQKRCPHCGSRMVLRTARRGAGAGNQFWGCSRYPQCRGTRNK